MVDLLLTMFVGVLYLIAALSLLAVCLLSLREKR